MEPTSLSAHKGSTTDSALKNRIDAMKEAVADEDNHQNLHVEFLDRGRVATWVRRHPSLILWVRNKIGRQLKGWRPYENWASAPRRDRRRISIGRWVKTA